MKIFDCFMYYNEDHILDLRLNYLNNFIDHFVIVESIYNHKGEKKGLNFDMKNFLTDINSGTSSVKAYLQLCKKLDKTKIVIQLLVQSYLTI